MQYVFPFYPTGAGKRTSKVSQIYLGTSMRSQGFATLSFHQDGFRKARAVIDHFPHSFLTGTSVPTPTPAGLGFRVSEGGFPPTSVSLQVFGPRSVWQMESQIPRTKSPETGERLVALPQSSVSRSLITKKIVSSPSLKQMRTVNNGTFWTRNPKN